MSYKFDGGNFDNYNIEFQNVIFVGEYVLFCYNKD